MATITQMKKIFEALEEAGLGDELIGGADHDIIYLIAPDGDVDEESELGQKLDELGAHFDEDNGWCRFV